MVKSSQTIARLLLTGIYLVPAWLYSPRAGLPFGLGLLGALIVYIILRRSSGGRRDMRGPLYFRLVFDVLLLTGLIYLTGDVHSIFLAGFGLIVVFRAVNSDSAFARSATALATLAVGGLSTALYQEWLPALDILGGTGEHRSWLEYASFTFGVALTGLLAGEFIHPLFQKAARDRDAARKDSHESRLDLVMSEKARFELETYSDFARKLNNSTDSFDDIIDSIFDYMNENFGMEGTVLYLVDQKRQVLTQRRIKFPPEAPPENVEFMRRWEISMNEEGGIHYHACRRKKPVYLPHLKATSIETDMVGVAKLGLKSILMVPLVVQDEVFGIIDFTAYQKKLNLSRDDIKSITLFCEQIAGAIKASQLVDEAREARRKMEESQAEIARLNEISRRINAISNLDEILETIFHYIKEQFQIEGIWLQFIDRDNQELYTYKSTRPPGMTEEQLRYIRALRVPLKEEGGLAYRVYERQKPFYMARTPKKYLTELDQKNADILQIQAALYMPLVINNECVAIISFTQFHKKMHLSPAQVEALSRFSEQIAGAINNSHLHTETEFSRIIAEEHLQEITKLKSQQDLDYFLTSQLIEPLTRIKLKSETVTVDHFIRQKKNFPYKVWNCEIGGDINLAETIHWHNRPYTVFLNADAMGKSIQGAGGILVLGSAFRIIIDRTEETKYKFPEQWLKNTYQELDRIFETFDGGMYITACLGMIDDTTGWMYWVNIEHPPPVLYRDSVSSIINSRHRQNKLGFTLGKSLPAVDMLQLHTGDSIFLGSDGREDVILHGTVDIMTGEGEFNRDDDFFGNMIEAAEGKVENIFTEIRKAGQITDDVSLLKLTYENDNHLPGDILTPDSARALAERGREMVREENHAGAIELLAKDAERIIEINTPLDAEFARTYDSVLEPYVEALYGAGENRETLRVALGYTALNPGSTSVLFHGARAAGRLDDLSLAADLGERVFLREPGLSENLVSLIDTHIQMRNLYRARFLLNELAKMDGSSNEDISELTGKLEKARARVDSGIPEDQERRIGADRRSTNDRRDGGGGRRGVDKSS